MAAAEYFSSVVRAEALTYMLCLSSENRAYSEGRTEAGYIFGRDIFVWLPTGFWKSICFQMLPFMFYRQHTWLGFISKNKKDVVLYTLFM